jgi:hypothetical protein
VAGPARTAAIVAHCAEAGTWALAFKRGRMTALPPAARRAAANVLIHALIPAAAGFAGAAIAKRRR